MIIEDYLKKGVDDDDGDGDDEPSEKKSLGKSDSWLETSKYVARRERKRERLERNFR